MSIYSDQFLEEESPVYKCACCGNAIYEGDDYYAVHVDNYDWKNYCKECVYELTAEDFYL